MPSINTSYQWAIQVCNMPNVGYSQTYRNQRKVNGIIYYDCSSFIWYALIAGGFDCVGVKGNTWPMTTANEANILKQLGFQQVPVSGLWKPGDIGLKTGHTEMVYEGYEGSGICMGAHTAKYTLERQVSIGTSARSDWTSLYRYIGESSTPTPGPIPGHSASLYVIAAICGNFWKESTVNPGIWQDLTENTGGFGLGQWSGERRYAMFNWAVENGHAHDNSGDWQLEYMLIENFWVKNGYGADYESLSDFLSSTSTDLTTLTYSFTQGWEGIPIQDDRVIYAQMAYDYISEHKNDTEIPTWIYENRYLTLEESQKQCLLVYRWFVYGSPIEPPNPDDEIIKIKMPIWMKIRYK